jgi:AcrR family transcriptional regulator
MNDVIAETGFSHGVVYRYYKDLDEIFRDLVIRINSESHLRERLDDFLAEPNHGEWEKNVYRICDLLADYLQEEEMDILKISVTVTCLLSVNPKGPDILQSS